MWTTDNTFAATDYFKSIVRDEVCGQHTGVLPKATSLVWGWNADSTCWILPGDLAEVLDHFLVNNCIQGFQYDHDL